MRSRIDNPPPTEEWRGLKTGHVRYIPFTKLKKHGKTNMTETIASGMIRQTVERAERLIDDRKAVSEDLKEVFAEARNNGLDVKALKAVIKYRAEDKAKREELEAVTELYLSAVGSV